MKLKKLLKNLDEYVHIKLVIDEGSVGDFELYIGEVYKVPWNYGDMKIDTDENGAGIDLVWIYDRQEKKVPCIRVYLKED